MRKVFIAYGDANCAYSLKRIGKQASKLGLFNDIILYTPDTLPSYIKSSPLMQHSYGGGYWAWKPCIIKETLDRYDDGDIVCYIDAGCSLQKGIEWTLYFELMKEYDTICFKYRDEYPQWAKFGATSTKIRYWGKKQTLEYLNQFVGHTAWQECNKIWGGMLFFKNKHNTILKDWLDITLHHPEIILDPSDLELKNQYPYFAKHKHDQVVLVALAFLHKDQCLVLPDLSDSCGKNVAIYASRIRAKDKEQYIILQLKYWGRFLLGDRIFEWCKSKLLYK
ncbi:MAG: hypothetical protein NC206_02905 [Bacteroides sp.]|nr:hypothetical protein [Roseburia sp.]MCM1346013.1 hypothetical protein [Bacteroides sp.]MCM1421479.1 hypothetical protein [Bacteroides sp.]